MHGRALPKNKNQMRISDITKMDKMQRTNFRIGLVIALVLAVSLMNMYIQPQKDNQDYVTAGLDIDELVVIPRTVEKKKVAPPPSAVKPTIIETPDLPEFTTEPEPTEIPDLPSDAKVVETNEPLNVKKPEPGPPPARVKPKEEPKELPFVMIAEQMPIYGDCNDLPKKEQTTCSNRQLLMYLAKAINYPALARENGISGTVVVQFIINKQGKMTDIELLKDIGGGCGREAIRAIKAMADWQPGKQRGIPVNVKMTLPVKFNLQ
jgi:protein TonB